MSAFDVAICMNESALNRVIASIYARPGFRDSLFRGSRQVSVGGVALSVGYDVLVPPTVRLEAPSPAQWQAAIRADGNAAAPTANALVAHFPQVTVTKSPGTPAASSSTITFDAIAVASLQGGRLAISPVGVCIDLSHSSSDDQILYRAVIIPRVLEMLATLLSAESVPNIHFQGVRFGAAVLTLGDGRLAAVANLDGRPGPAAPAPGSLPAVPFCVLLSQAAMQGVAAAGTAGLRGKHLSQSGGASFGIGTAQYTATLTVDGLSVQVQDPVTVNANVALSASASASVDVLGYVWDQISGGVTSAAGTVADGIQTAANAVAQAFSSY